MYYKILKINGVEYPIAVNITGMGAPTSSTEAVVGMFYMDETNGEVYKFTPDGWKPIGGSSVELSQTTGTSETAVMSQKATTYAIDIARQNAERYTDDEIARLEGYVDSETDYVLDKLEVPISNHETRLENLERHINQDYFLTDDSIAYRKLVPLSACPYAGISKVGGMTYKCTNLLSYPYHSSDRTIDSLTISTNNGVITLNGDGITQIYDFILVGKTSLPTGTYTISGCTNGASETYRLFLWIVRANGSPVYVSQTTEPRSFTIYEGDTITQISVRIAATVGQVSNVTISPMLNVGSTALPFEPYYEGLKHSKVTKIVSRGKNLLSSDVLSRAGWENYNGDWWKYDLDLPDGWYCISAKLKPEYNNAMYLYFAKSTDGGNTYSSASAIYFSDGKVGTGYLITDGGVTSAPYWFKVDKKAGTLYRLQSLYAKQSDFDQIEYIQIEAVELAQEPSTSYPPSKYAPASEYVPYNPNPIDTVVIPSAITIIDGYGESNPDNADEYNYIDFERKKFVAVGHFDGEAWVTYETPVETDLSGYSALEECIEVVGRGHLEFVNEENQAVPSEVTYLLKEDK